YNIQSFFVADYVSGQDQTTSREAAFARGVDRVLIHFGEQPDSERAEGDKYVRNFNAENLSCGVSCSSKQFQIEILKAMGCEDASLAGGGEDNVGSICSSNDYQTDLNGVILLSDSLRLTETLYGALLSANGSSVDPV